MNTNNSPEMKTIVETFLIEETQELIYDNDKLEQWNKHVADLGLKGQTKIVSGTKSPIPFMHMKKTVCEMFKILCPRIVEVSEYDVTPIPVEILELIALSKRENYFNAIKIWYDDKSPDPICVGVKGEYTPISEGYKWHHEIKKSSGQECIEWMNEKGLIPYSTPHHFSENNFYLLGKWADVKASFSELRERARQRYIIEKGADLRKSIKEDQRKLDDLETDALQLLGA